MLGNTWRVAAMIIAVVVAAALCGVAQAARNPVPANLKQRIVSTADKCHALFPSDKDASCDLTGIKKVDSYLRRAVSAAKWKRVVQINAATLALCKSVAPYAAAKLTSHNLGWSSTGYVFSCYWGGNSADTTTGMVSMQVAAPGHKFDTPTCFPDQVCNSVGRSMFKQNRDTSPCNSAVNKHSYCNQWNVENTGLYLQINNWGWSDKDLAVHKSDYDVLVSRLVASLGLATG